MRNLDMSYHSNINPNIKQNKCGSCKFYSAERKIKKGIVFGDSLDIPDKGVCMSKNSPNYSKIVYANGGKCPRYQKWSVLQNATDQNTSTPSLDTAIPVLEGVSSKERKKIAKKVMKISLIVIGIFFGTMFLIGLGVYIYSIFAMM